MGLFTPFAYIRNKQIVSALDPDAVAFLTAAGITDPTITSAINTLVIDLKDDGLWTKMYAIYPFVGGTATTHKYNLKNPADTDAAYRLVFSGGITHSSTGIKGNGTNGFYDTKLIGTDLLQNNAAMGTYIRDNIAEEKVDLGYLRVAPSLSGLQLNSRDTSNLILTRINSSATQSVSNTDSRGLISVSRLSSSSAVISKNTTQTSASVTSVAPVAFPVLGLCFYLTSAANFFSTREQAYSYFGEGLSDSELDAHYTIVQAFQTTLGRQV